jgi:hypothetical protein
MYSQLIGKPLIFYSRVQSQIQHVWAQVVDDLADVPDGFTPLGNTMGAPIRRGLHHETTS